MYTFLSEQVIVVRWQLSDVCVYVCVCVCVCDNQLVGSVARHAVWYGRMKSPLCRNMFYCCHRYGVS